MCYIELHGWQCGCGVFLGRLLLLLRFTFVFVGASQLKNVIGFTHLRLLGCG